MLIDELVINVRLYLTSLLPFLLRIGVFGDCVRQADTGFVTEVMV